MTDSPFFYKISSTLSWHIVTCCDPVERHVHVNRAPPACNSEQKSCRKLGGNLFTYMKTIQNPLRKRRKMNHNRIPSKIQDYSHRLSNHMARFSFLSLLYLPFPFAFLALHLKKAKQKKKKEKTAIKRINTQNINN